MGLAFRWTYRKPRVHRRHHELSLPPEVVEHIASKLGIMTAETKQALSEISLPEGVAVTITRKKNNDQLTIKKQPGGSPYDVTYKGSTTKIDI